MSHIFDPKQFKKLESPERKALLPASMISDLLGLSSSHVLADVGCGIGYFSFPFSSQVSQVYAIDISEIMIEELKKRNTNQNIVPLLGNFDELLINDSLDLFFTATVIHELNDLSDFTRHALSKIKVGGRIAYLDFEKKAMDFGPPVSKRIHSTSVIELFESMSLKSIVVHTINDVFYMVVGEK